MVQQRTEIKRHPERAVPEQTVEILAAGRVAHLAFAEDQNPVAIPFGYHYDTAEPRRLYLHGSRASRALTIAASGAPVCIAVTLLDGLVYSKTALNHSLNYRSVVCFGRGREIKDEATQRSVYERMIARYHPGRTAGIDYQPPTEAHLEATMLVEVLVEGWSAKARSGGPMGPLDSDPNAPGTCGVVPLG